jgi:hypothetical protein
MARRRSSKPQKYGVVEELILIPFLALFGLIDAILGGGKKK